MVSIQSTLLGNRLIRDGLGGKKRRKCRKNSILLAKVCVKGKKGGERKFIDIFLQRLTINPTTSTLNARVVAFFGFRCVVYFRLSFRVNWRFFPRYHCHNRIDRQFSGDFLLVRLKKRIRGKGKNSRNQFDGVNFDQKNRFLISL